MISLKDLWQQQRLQRQQGVAQLQQQVRDDLAQMQQDRLEKATELHAKLKQFQIELQQETQIYLQTLSEQRQREARVLFSNLRNVTEALQKDTYQFLNVLRADRQVRAEELFQTLNLFRAELSISVEALRKNLQVEIQTLREEVRTLCAETQTYLTVIQQERIREAIQVAETLSRYVESLRNQVGEYLAELNQMDQLRAQELQVRFQAQRQERAAEMEALFEDLAIFRGELREYCRDLHAMVWGNGDSNGGVAPLMPAPQATPSKPAPSPSVNGGSNGVSNGRLSAPTQPKPPTPGFSASATAAPTPAQAPAPTPAPDSTSNTLTMVAEPPPPADAPDTSIDTFADSVQESPADVEPVMAMTWGTTPITPARKEILEVEEDILNHLQQAGGARLTEIESALDINRFQAVDALRSLIKKGRVTQRDRVYVIQ